MLLCSIITTWRSTTLQLLLPILPIIRVLPTMMRRHFNLKTLSCLSYRPSSTSLLPLRCYSQNNDDNSGGSNSSKISNKSLNLSFQGLIPKLLALQKVLLSDKGLDEYVGLKLRGIFKSTFHALVLYSHLQNPLLKKYAFDVVDFFEGAKESMKMILEFSGSKDFVEYSVGKPISSVTLVPCSTHINTVHIFLVNIKL